MSMHGASMKIPGLSLALFYLKIYITSYAKHSNSNPQYCALFRASALETNEASILRLLEEV